ncbi:MAG: hypothetical protein H7338_15485 [Candidatus Sericytochromatia bacterium]|nr:hypothetical protein [Candidatus Sericytochromatia bacterium]
MSQIIATPSATPSPGAAGVPGSVQPSPSPSASVDGTANPPASAFPIIGEPSPFPTPLPVPTRTPSPSPTTYFGPGYPGPQG